MKIFLTEMVSKLRGSKEQWFVNLRFFDRSENDESAYDMYDWKEEGDFDDDGPVFNVVPIDGQ